MDTTVEIAGRKIDLAQALPFTWGDWIDLEAKNVTLESLQRQPPMMTDIFHVIVAMALKVDPGLKEEDVRNIPIDDPAVQNALMSIAAGKADAPDPSS